MPFRNGFPLFTAQTFQFLTGYSGYRSYVLSGPNIDNTTEQTMHIKHSEHRIEMKSMIDQIVDNVVKVTLLSDKDYNSVYECDKGQMK